MTTGGKSRRIYHLESRPQVSLKKLQGAELNGVFRFSGLGMGKAKAKTVHYVNLLVALIFSQTHNVLLFFKMHYFNFY